MMLLRFVLKLVARNGPGVMIVLASRGTAPASNLGHPPVDNEIDSRRETTVVRGEIEDRSRDLRRKPEASQRNQRDEVVRQFFGNSGEGSRVADRARTNAVHPDFAILQVVRPASRERPDCCLGGRVHACSSKSLEVR